MREPVLVEKLVPGGAGMVRLADGEIGFVPGVLPGERVEVEWGSSKQRVRRGRLLRVVAASAQRVSEPCPVAAACGGCDWLHVDYSAQLAQKAELVREALTRTGGLRELPAFAIEPSPAASHYRSRIRVHFQPDGALGFFAAGTHRVIDVSECWAARPELNGALTSLRQIAGEFPALAELFAEAELRVGAPPGVCSLRLERRAERARRTAAETELVRALSAHFQVSLDASTTESVLRYELGDRAWLELPAQAFVQVNWALNQRLVAWVVAEACARGLATFADLYAGAGNFSVALASAGMTGVSVEGHPAASRAAERALSVQGYARQVRVIQNDAPDWLSRQPAPLALDWVLLDPPRAGARALTGELVRRRPRYIGYCSCDPVTLARDARELVRGGYQLEALRGFDMFPGTHHVEIFAWFRADGP